MTDDIIHTNYIIIGLVKSFLHVERGNTKQDNQWAWKEERLTVFLIDIERWDVYQCYQLNHPRNEQVRVVVIRKYPGLDGLNQEVLALM